MMVTLYFFATNGLNRQISAIDIRGETASRDLWNSCSEYWLRQQLYEGGVSIFMANQGENRRNFGPGFSWWSRYLCNFLSCITEINVQSNIPKCKIPTMITSKYLLISDRTFEHRVESCKSVCRECARSSSGSDCEQRCWKSTYGYLCQGFCPNGL